VQNSTASEFPEILVKHVRCP